MVVLSIDLNVSNFMRIVDPKYGLIGRHSQKSLFLPVLILNPISHCYFKYEADTVCPVPDSTRVTFSSTFNDKVPPLIHLCLYAIHLFNRSKTPIAYLVQ